LSVCASTGFAFGRTNAIVMNAIQTTDVSATGYEKGPRWKGPRVKRAAWATRRAMGIATGGG
jgi:hypothetical protein